MAQALPPKEQGLFKSVVRLYETKMFKKAIKTADQILKRFPEHGETLAMKGLTVNQLDRKEEAHDLVRRGLRKDMKSHICWHVYGLLYRSDHDYHQAARSYVNALRLDPDNQQILLDLALLQVQIRDYEGFEESRRKLLNARPNQKTNWIGVAIAFHLQANYDKTLEVVKTYLKTLSTDAQRAQDPFEHSELLLYRVSVLEEAGDFAGALTHLDQDERLVLDSLAVRETRARLLMRLDRHEEAAKVLRALIAINPDNHSYHGDLRAAVIRTRPACDAAALLRASLDICDSISAEYPHSRAGLRIALGLLPSGDHPEFLPRADRYVRPFLRRGAPSLFADLKSLHADASKAAALLSLFETYSASMQATPAALPPLLPLKGEEGGAEAGAESASVMLWIHHYLAQHYDRMGQVERALVEAEKCIAHPATAVECLMVKARILKHCGDTRGALAVADDARRRDLSDRFVNTKGTKYALRADNVPQAEAWIALFTRDGDSGGVQALYDMQCIWYELEAAESHLRCGQLAAALKKFMAVERHFADMIEDQFDFHTYCLRKVTLRSYVRMLRMEDSLRSHAYFERAATGAARCLLLLHDMPRGERVATTGGSSDIAGFSEMSEAERKKALSKKKKRDAKRRAKDLEVAAGAAANGTVGPAARGGADDAKASSAGEKKAKKDETSSNAKKSSAAEKAKNPGWMEADVDGLEHVKSLLSEAKKDVSPLAEAAKRVRLLEQFEADKMQTHALAFEVAMRRRQYLQALRAVRRAQAIDVHHPDALMMAVRLVHEVDAKALSPEAAAVFAALGDVLNGAGVVEAVDAYVVRHAGHAGRQLGAGEVMLWLAQADVAGARSVDKAAAFINEALQAVGVTLRGSGAISCDDGYLSAPRCAEFWRRLSAVRPALPAAALGPIEATLRGNFPRATLFSTL